MTYPPFTLNLNSHHLVLNYPISIFVPSTSLASLVGIVAAFVVVVLILVFVAFMLARLFTVVVTMLAI